MTHGRQHVIIINMYLTPDVHRPVGCFGFLNEDVLRSAHLLLPTASQINEPL